MKFRWAIFLLAVLISLVISGCVEESQYENEAFMEWIEKTFDHVKFLNEQLLDAVDKEDYDKIEAVSDIAYYFDLKYYNQAKGFKVSGKYVELQDTVESFFLISSDFHWYLKEFAYYFKRCDYDMANYYLKKALEISDERENKLKYISILLDEIEGGR